MKRRFYRIIAFFSLIRVQNITALLLAQIFIGKRIFQRNLSWKSFLWNEKFLLFLLATLLVITAGYIIDGFYNFRRDMINRPAKTLREQQLGINQKLYLYFLLNLTAVLMAWFVSWRAAWFFALFIFLIWLYFHKWQFKPWFHEIFPAILIMYPFFGVMLFYKQWNEFVLWAGALVFITLVWKEIIKEFLTLKGDVSQGFETLLISKGETFVRRFALAWAWVWLLAWWGLYHVTTSARFHVFMYLLFLWMMGIFYWFYRGRYPQAYVAVKLFVIAGILSIWLI